MPDLTSISKKEGIRFIAGLACAAGCALVFPTTPLVKFNKAIKSALEDVLNLYCGSPVACAAASKSSPDSVLNLSGLPQHLLSSGSAACCFNAVPPTTGCLIPVQLLCCALLVSCVVLLLNPARDWTVLSKDDAGGAATECDAARWLCALLSCCALSASGGATTPLAWAALTVRGVGSRKSAGASHCEVAVRVL